MESKYLRNNANNNKIGFHTILVSALYLAIPLDYVLPHFGNATVVTLMCGIIIFSSIFERLLTGKSFVISYNSQFLIFTSIIYLISFVWAENKSVAISSALSITFTVALYLSIIQFEFDEHDIYVVENSAILGGVLLVLYIINSVDLDLVYAGYRLKFSQLGSEYFSDPNGLAGRIMFPLLLSINRIIQKHGIVKKTFYLLIVSLLAYVLFLTGSRSGVIGFALAIIIFIISGYRNNISWSFAGIIIILSLIYIAPGFLPQHIVDRVYNIAKYNEVTVLEGDRFDIWKHVILNLFPSSPIWGYGGGHAGIALSQFYGHIKAVHNSFLVILGDTGLLGFIPWMYFNFQQLKQAIHARIDNTIILPACIAIFVVAFTLDAQTEKYLWSLYIYLYMIQSSNRIMSERYRYDQE